MDAGLIFISGMRGSGKSLFARKCAKLASSQGKLVLVHDCMRDWEKWRCYDENIILLNCDAETAAQEAIKNAPCTLIYDEARLAIPCHGKPAPSAEDILTYGRHMNVGLIALTQRPALVNKTITSLTNIGVFFRTISRYDVDFIANNYGEEYTKKLPELKPLEYVVYGA